MLLSFLASMAQEESRKTSARVTWGQTRQMERGVVFGPSLLGYTVKGGQITVNPPEAGTVRLIFHKYALEQTGATEIARYLMQNAYVFEADLVLYNPKLITKYQYTSNYLGVPTHYTDDWCFETKNKVITKVKVGGNNCHHMFGISYWDQEAGTKLFDDIKKVYEMPGGKERYWDQVPLEYCLSNYTVEVRECTFDDIVEIDSFADLKKIDPIYR